MTAALTALDATLLELEELTEGAVMNIGAVMVFDPLPEGGVPSVEEVYALVEDRLSALPGYRQRLSSERTGGWAWPHWVLDEQFQVENHITRAALPSPGGEAELCGWIADFYSHLLDRTRPLWEVVLLEGLEGGQWALAHKLHHCLVSEVGSVGAAELLLDSQTQPADASRSFRAVDARPAWRYLIPEAPATLAQAARAGERLTVSGLHAAVRPRQTLAHSRMLAEALVQEEMIGAPECSLNVPIGASRRYAAVRRPLADVIAISHALGGPVSDVALAACTAGLRRLLLERDEDLPPGGLRAMFPVSLREAPDAIPVEFRLIDLPVAEAAAAVRHGQILAATRRHPLPGAWDPTGALVGLASFAPPVVHASLARALFGTRLFNLTIASVRGAQRTRYAFGAALREVHPIIPLAAEHAVGIAIFSQDGQTMFGITADRESMPDLAVLALGIEEGIEDLFQSV